MGKLNAWCEKVDNHEDMLHLVVGRTVRTALDSHEWDIFSYFNGRVRKGKFAGHTAYIVQTSKGEKVIQVLGGGYSFSYLALKGMRYGTASVNGVSDLPYRTRDEIVTRLLSSSDKALYLDGLPSRDFVM
jgi:hypothetical protein